jgi:hypothetical protein
VAEWSGQKEMGEGERCWLYMPGAVHGELGQEGEREGGAASALAGNGSRSLSGGVGSGIGG